VQTRHKLGLLAALYFSQGLPFGFFDQAVPTMLAIAKYTPEQIGLSSALAVPWALKFAWAPAVDRYYFASVGRRRSWILPLQTIAVAVFLGLGALDIQHSLPWLAAAMLVANTVAATQDIATDGLAVSLLAPHERGVGNGVQVAAYRVGMVLGGGFLLVVFERLGWRLAFAVLAGLLALATLPAWLYCEASSDGARSAEKIDPSSGLLADARDALARPGMLGWLLVLIVYKSGDAFATKMIKPFLVMQAGYGLDDVGWLIGVGGSVTGLLGALAGGAAVSRLGRARSLWVFGTIQAVAVGAYAIPAAVPASRALGLPAVVLVEHFTGGLATAALFTAMMDASRPERGGTDYTLQACAVLVAGGVFTTFSGYSVASFGWTGHFAVAAGVSLVAVAVAARFADAPVFHAGTPPQLGVIPANIGGAGGDPGA
jgi:PAT family beta-lactamase induction signal transducer AmpG